MLVCSRPFGSGVEFIVDSHIYTLAHRSHKLIKKESLVDFPTEELLKYGKAKVFSILYLKGVSTTVAVCEYSSKLGRRVAAPLATSTYKVLRETWLKNTRLQGFARMELPTPDGVIVQEIMVVTE